MPPLISVDELKASRTPESVIITTTRELRLSRLLIAYIAMGLFFMLLPGTFLGVWNLLAISSQRSVETVSPAWIQAHGHAQVFGWIGSFILGIGYYSIPKLRRMRPFALWSPWTSLLMWFLGVSLRWLAGVYQWHWRLLLPLSAALEIAAFLIFLPVVSSHGRANEKANHIRPKLDEWIFVVITGCIGWLAALVINLLSALFLAWRDASPVLPHGFDQRLLVLETWGFLVPFVWGFSAKWLPIFLGLRTLHSQRLPLAVALNLAGVIAALFGRLLVSSLLLLMALSVAIYALRLFEPSERPPKNQGRACQLPGICPPGLRLGVRVRNAGDLGFGHGQFCWNLGRIATCAHGWLCSDDGVLRRATCSSGIFWNVIAVQHKTDVCRSRAAFNGLSSASRF
jgi:uncharacterized protein involved in response to NO